MANFVEMTDEHVEVACRGHMLKKHEGVTRLTHERLTDEAAPVLLRTLFLLFNIIILTRQ